MIKKLLTILTLAALLLTPLFGCNATEEADPIRIHIRAQSNADIDQAVKFIVRDRVVEYLAPALSSAKSRDDAYKTIEQRLSQINALVLVVLRDCGFNYSSTTSMQNEYFPDRDYGGKVYPAGYYDALIIRLGSGNGGNWWCVAYPPLCFYGDSEEEFRYSSLIAELLGK